MSTVRKQLTLDETTAKRVGVTAALLGKSEGEVIGLAIEELWVRRQETIAEVLQSLNPLEALDAVRAAPSEPAPEVGERPAA